MRSPCSLGRVPTSVTTSSALCARPPAIIEDLHTIADLRDPNQIRRDSDAGATRWPRDQPWITRTMHRTVRVWPRAPAMRASRLAGRRPRRSSNSTRSPPRAIRPTWQWNSGPTSSPRSCSACTTLPHSQWARGHRPSIRPPPASASSATSRQTSLSVPMQNSPDLLTRALQNPTLLEAKLGRRRRARDGTDRDVLAWIEATFGVRIPAVACCEGHVAPAQAFCDALFARAPVALWIASRGFGASCDAPPRKGARHAREPGGGGRTPPVCAPQVAYRPPHGLASDRGTRGDGAGRRGRTRPRAGPDRASKPRGPDALLGDTQSDRLGGGSPNQRR